jgi:protein-S-isoprenylcysteine O-methyltransferase Ste14
MTSERASRNFGIAQTVLLFAFAAVFFLDDGARLFSPGGAASAIGTALCVVGLLLMLAAFISLRAVIQVEPEPRRDGHLVMNGVYAVLRHPIYTAISIVIVGLFLRKPTVFVGLAGAGVIGFLLVKVQLEERLLAARFPEYAGYMSRTWGMIPGLGRRTPSQPRP